MTRLLKWVLGETAIDLTDPEDFQMMAILRRTEVCRPRVAKSDLNKNRSIFGQKKLAPKMCKLRQMRLCDKTP